MDILESLLNDDLYVEYTGKGFPMYSTQTSFEIKNYPNLLPELYKGKKRLFSFIPCDACRNKKIKQRITYDSPIIRYIKDTNKRGEVITIKITRHRNRCMNCRKSFFDDRIDYLNSNSMFSKDYKKAVINRVLDTETTFSEISKKFELSINTIKNFMKCCKEINEVERIKIYNAPVINIFPFEYKNKTACCISGFTKVGSVYKKGILGILQNYNEETIKKYLKEYFIDKSSVKIVICRLNREVITTAKEVFPKAEVLINHLTFNDDIYNMITCKEYDLLYLVNDLQGFCKDYKSDSENKWYISINEKEIEEYENKNWQTAIKNWFESKENITEEQKEHLKEAYTTLGEFPKEVLNCIKELKLEPKNNKVPEKFKDLLPKKLRNEKIFNTKEMKDLIKKFSKRGYKFTGKEFSVFAIRLLFLNPAVKFLSYKIYKEKISSSMKFLSHVEVKQELLHGYYVDVDELKHILDDPTPISIQSSKYYSDYLEKRNRLIYPE